MDAAAKCRRLRRNVVLDLLEGQIDGGQCRHVLQAPQPAFELVQLAAHPAQLLLDGQDFVQPACCFPLREIGAQRILFELLVLDAVFQVVIVVGDVQGVGGVALGDTELHNGAHEIVEPGHRYAQLPVAGARHPRRTGQLRIGDDHPELFQQALQLVLGLVEVTDNQTARWRCI